MKTPTSRFWSRADGRLHVQWYRGVQPVHYAPHTHSEFNIVVSLEGAVETHQAGDRTLVEPGAAMMGSHPGVVHESWYRPGSRGCEAVSWTFSPELFAEVAGAGARLYLGAVHAPVVAQAARDTIQEMRQRALGHGHVIESLAWRVLIECLRQWPVGGMGPYQPDTTPRLSRRDHVRACEFMRWCRKDEFRIQNLCRWLGTSEERFNRLFRAATNESPAGFYQRLLLDEARERLSDPHAAVKEIGYELGFKTPSHFSASFRRQFGCTPQEYRLGEGARWKRT